MNDYVMESGNPDLVRSAVERRWGRVLDTTEVHAMNQVRAWFIGNRETRLSFFKLLSAYLAFDANSTHDWNVDALAAALEAANDA
jgi:hypothetical protein